jgi:hypothetical protein
MIRHVVFFKFKAGAAEGDRKSGLEALRGLPAKIGVIRKFEVGENVLPSARAWDAALIAEYDNLEDLREYTDHPDHMAAVQLLFPVCEAVGSVDYEH